MSAAARVRTPVLLSVVHLVHPLVRDLVQVPMAAGRYKHHCSL